MPASQLGRQAQDSVGCKFALRCPHAFELCLKTPPPLYQIEPHQAAACYLYREHSAIPSEKMDQVFVQRKLPPDERTAENSVAQR
jgi:hypothetical protein